MTACAPVIEIGFVEIDANQDWQHRVVRLLDDALVIEG